MSRYFVVSNKGKMPVMNPNGCVDLCSSMGITVPSIWKGYLNIAGTGFNSISNKINHFLGSSSFYNYETDYMLPFKPILIPTGLRVYMDCGEVLTLYGNREVYQSGIILAGNQVFFNGDEVFISVYNMLPKDVIINANQIVAKGLFYKVMTELSDPNFDNGQDYNTYNTVAETEKSWERYANDLELLSGKEQDNLNKVNLVK